MNKLILKMFAVTFAVAVFSTNANAKSTLQEDIDNGAVPLTTSEMHSVFINNTQVGVGAKWAVYNMPDGNRIVAVEGAKTKKRKWWIDTKKGWCVLVIKTKRKFVRLSIEQVRMNTESMTKKASRTHFYSGARGHAEFKLKGSVEAQF